MIKNNTILDLKINLGINEYSPINSYCYNTSGKLLGKVSDIEFDEKFNISKFIIDESEIESNRLA